MVTSSMVAPTSGRPMREVTVEKRTPHNLFPRSRWKMTNTGLTSRPSGSKIAVSAAHNALLFSRLAESQMEDSAEALGRD